MGSVVLPRTRSIAATTIFGLVLVLAVDASSTAKVLRLPVWSVSGHEIERSGLRVYGGKSRLRVVNLLPPTAPTILFVVFDLTSSASAAQEMRPALVAQLANLPDNYWIGLMSSADGLHIIQDPTQDRSSLEREVNAAYPNGHPGLLDSVTDVESIATRVMRKGGVRVAVLWITDSNVDDYRANYANQQVNGSDVHDMSRRFQGRDLQARLDRLGRDLLTLQAPLNIVHMVDREDPLNRQYRNGLMRLSESVGGTMLLARTRAEIAPALAQAFVRVRNFYLLSVETPNTYSPIELSISLDRPESEHFRSTSSGDLEWRRFFVPATR